jgi:ABC-type transporter lipoprotein component MlaA
MPSTAVRAPTCCAGNVLDEAALDKYSFTRDAYLQRRRAEVYDQDEEDGKCRRRCHATPPRRQIPRPSRPRHRTTAGPPAR